MTFAYIGPGPEAGAIVGFVYLLLGSLCFGSLTAVIVLIVRWLPKLISHRAEIDERARQRVRREEDGVPIVVRDEQKPRNCRQ
jgi:hypothetical protein